MLADHPVTDLMSDHRLIEKVMAAVEAQLGDGARPFPAVFVEEALAFFTEFADAHHHLKEEQILFPALAARGVPPAGGPIGVMLYEHALGRQLLAVIRDHLPAARDGDDSAHEAIRDAAGHYIELLRQHIWKEDTILFQMARQVLDPAAAEEVLEQFAKHRTSAVSRHATFAAGLPG
ncbi:MAG: hemerythrin domain-containing protein [Bryobacterales bacterium]|nr:hemerythrin domain-containing protein [Bryobacterales bacterium]